MTESLNSPVALALALTLLHFVWQGCVVALAYVAFVRSVAPLSARVRYSTAIGLFVVMACCPVLTFARTYQSEWLLTQTTTNTSMAMTLGHSDSAYARDSLQVRLDSGRADEVVDAISSQKLFSAIVPYLLSIWMLGVVFCAMRLLSGYAHVRRLQQGRQRVEPCLARRIKSISRRIGLTNVAVYASHRIHEAAVVGFWRPAILLPASWITSLSPDVLEAIIAHELAHVRRYDVWVNLMQRIVESIFFYHPAVWWLSNHVRLEREMCCDEIAVNATSNRGSYAQALEQVGRLSLRKPVSLQASLFTPAPLGATFTGDKNMNLLRRVQNVLSPIHRSGGRSDRGSTWAAGALAVAMPMLVIWFSLIPAMQTHVVAQEGRRAAEADTPRRSAEAEANTRSPEDEANLRRGQPERNSERARFQPQTEREAELYRMITELRREVASLRKQISPRRSGQGSESFNRESSPSRDGDRDHRRDQLNRGQVRLPDNWQNTREGKVFNAYDKDRNAVITLDEWLAMTNGNANEVRRKIQVRRFQDAEPNGDGQFTPVEFFQWYGVERHRDSRSGERRRDGDLQPSPRSRNEGYPGSDRRDGERRPATGVRDGDLPRSGLRDGDLPRSGFREGDIPRRGPRDGEGVKRGARDPGSSDRDPLQRDRG